jgi:hypothetical protein
MKALHLTPIGALLVAMISGCGSNSSGGGSGGSTGSGGATGTGGSTTPAGTGGATGTGGAVGAAGATGTGGATASGGATGAGGGSPAGTGGATATPDAGSTPDAGGGPPATITSTQFGAFNNAFLVTVCGARTQGFDCPNATNGGSCNQTGGQFWSYPQGNGTITTTEAIGNTYVESFVVSGGVADGIYAVTLRVRGQTEGRIYTGGQATPTPKTPPSVINPGAALNDMLYTGGRPGTTRVDYNSVILTISGGTAVPNAPTFYAFNATDATHEGQHFNYAVDETVTIRVRVGQTINIINHDSNCIAIQNCGANGGSAYNFGTPAQCDAVARPVPAGITLPATFLGQTLTNRMPGQNFQTQFLNFAVTSIVAE